MPRPENEGAGAVIRDDHTCGRCTARGVTCRGENPLSELLRKLVLLKNRGKATEIFTKGPAQASTSLSIEPATQLKPAVIPAQSLKVIPAIATTGSRSCSLQAVHSVDRLHYQPLKRAQPPFEAVIFPSLLAEGYTSTSAEDSSIKGVRCPLQALLLLHNHQGSYIQGLDQLLSQFQGYLPLKTDPDPFILIHTFRYLSQQSNYLLQNNVPLLSVLPTPHQVLRTLDDPQGSGNSIIKHSGGH